MLVSLEVIRGNSGQESNIVLRMKVGKFSGGCGVRTVAFHLFVETVRQDEVVSELETVRLHGVRWAIVKVTYFWMIEVRHSFLCRHADGCKKPSM
jgi:hypothetical protein